MTTDGPLQATTDLEVQHARVLRIALGTALCLLVSQMLGWRLSFLAPVITLFVLAMPKPSPGIVGGIKLFLAVVLASYSGFALLPLLLHQPAAGLCLLAIVLFYAFYLAARGAPAAIATLVVIGLALVVGVGSVSVDALLSAAESVAANAALGIAFVLVAFTLVRDPDGNATDTQTPDPVAAAPARSALRSTIIVLPVALWLLFSSTSTGSLGFMIKVASMGQQASAGDARAVARSLIVSTVAGGGAALVAWQLLSIWPSLVLYALIVGLAGLLFGSRVFRGRSVRADGATWSYAYLTMILILGPAVLDGITGAPAGAKFFDRLWMFGGATAYGVAAVYAFDSFVRRRR